MWTDIRGGIRETPLPRGEKRSRLSLYSLFQLQDVTAEKDLPKPFVSDTSHLFPFYLAQIEILAWEVEKLQIEDALFQKCLKLKRQINLKRRVKNSAACGYFKHAFIMKSYSFTKIAVHLSSNSKKAAQVNIHSGTINAKFIVFPYFT